MLAQMKSITVGASKWYISITGHRVEEVEGGEGKG